MPVRTRQQAMHAADHLPYSHHADGPVSVAHSELPDIRTSSVDLHDALRNRANINADIPQTAGRSMRRKVCKASSSDEQMVADMQAFEQQMVETCHDHPANFHDAEAAARQHNLMSIQRQAEALQDAEAMMQQDLQVAAELTQLQLCSDRLQQAAEFVLKPSRFGSLSPTDLNSTISAANHLLSVCQNARNGTQQAELQNLRHELQQLRTLNQCEQRQCLDLQRANRELLLAKDELRTQLDTEAEKKRCCICMAAQKDVMLFPCMHTDFCTTCIGKHMQHGKNCPICRVPVRGVLPTHLAR